MPEDKEITIRQAAYMTGKSERWIRIQINKGILPARKDPMGEIYVWLIKSSDLEIWMKRPPSPRGRAAGPDGRARYIINMPQSPTFEALLTMFVSTLENATLQRGRGPILVDTRKKTP